MRVEYKYQVVHYEYATVLQIIGYYEGHTWIEEINKDLPFLRFRLKLAKNRIKKTLKILIDL